MTSNMHSPRRSPSVKLISIPAPAQPVSTQSECELSPSPSAANGSQHKHGEFHQRDSTHVPSQSPFRYVTGYHQHSLPSPHGGGSSCAWNEKAGDASFSEVVLSPIRVSPPASGSISRSPSRGWDRHYRSESSYGLDEKQLMNEAPSIAGPSGSGRSASQCRLDTVAHNRPSNLVPATCASPLHPSPLSSMSSAHSGPPSKWLLRERIRPWIPYILYAATSLGFVLAITFWKDDVFRNLDELSHWLRDEGESGYLLLGAMIFVTCIPPLPLYSTLQVLSGYTFGAWVGGIVSYVSAFLGALFVFGVSRLYFRRVITRTLSHTKSFRRVVRAIARRPSLLFLVRLAPYPYNMLNALLAGAPTLTFKTYAGCTALSLFKVWIHTTIGASIHSFAAYHVHKPKGEDGDSSAAPDLKNGDDDSDMLSQATTIGGLVLCIAIAVYLSIVARRAVNEELDDDADDNMEEMEEGSASRSRPPSIIERLHARERERERARERRLGNNEETAAFLASNDEGSNSSQSFDVDEQELSDRSDIRLGSPSLRR